MARRRRGETPTPDLSQVRGFSFALESGAEALQLRAGHRADYGPVRVDWLNAEMRRRVAAGRRQPLARAVGLHKLKPTDPPLTLLDATAGFGRDGATLAALGVHVTLVERNPAMQELLLDAQRRLAAAPGQEDLAANLEILCIDARELMAGARRWDVIYLDPMYPDDRKTALPSKEMQLLRDLTGGDADADALLMPALAAARLRVVVKRPSKAPWLAGLEPSMSLTSTQLRFDVHVKAAMPTVV